MNMSTWLLTGMLGWGLLAQAGVQKASSKDDDEAPDAGQVVERVQEFYEDTKDYQARFKQVYKNKLMNETKKSTGKVYIKRPGKMRWEYEKPSEKLFVSDGETLWVYEKEAQQVYRQKLAESDLPTAIAFLMGEGDLAEDFDYKLIENDKAAAKGLLVLQLVPKEPTTHYKKLLFMVDDGTFQVRRTIIIDASGNTNSMRFSKVKTNKGLSDAEFDFEIPKGASLVE